MNVCKKTASVKVQGIASPVKVPVTSDTKPAVREQLKNKWQNLIDVLAECLIVPAGLIMQLDEDKISVFLSSRTRENPYSEGDSETLMLGLYCETVVGTEARLLVPDARKDKLWMQNPDISLGMYSYLGFPIRWPDGEIFGTLCVLDTKENSYSEKYISLMEILRATIEDDLNQLQCNYDELLSAYNRLSETLDEREIMLSEIHHRVKNNMQIISSLVELQSSNDDDIRLKNKLDTIRNRVQAMGICHEALYRSENFRDVNLSDYIGMLVKNLHLSLAADDIDLDYRILIDESLFLNFETVIPVGLIINEIVTNSIKHAFTGMKKGNITVKMIQESETDYKLEVSDDGCGMPLNSKEGRNGIGYTLTELLVKQLDGSLGLSTDNGTAYSIRLKKIRKEETRWKRKSS